MRRWSPSLRAQQADGNPPSLLCLQIYRKRESQFLINPLQLSYASANLNRITNETERPESSAVPAETSSSSAAVSDEQPSHQMTSPYNPNVYKCTGYRGEPLEYFDGTPGEGNEQRFTIDLEHGTMDR